MKNRKVCFVTGANEGLGLFLTKSLLENGYLIAAICHHRESIQNTRWDHLSLNADLTSENDVKKAIQRTIGQFGKIDIVINAAEYRPFEKESGSFLSAFSDQAIRQDFENQLFGSFHVLKQIMPFLKNQGSGHIFTFPTGSRIAAVADPVIYKATRLAVESLSENLIRELKTQGIRFTRIDPERSVPESISEGDIYKWILQKLEAVQLNPIIRNTFFYERTVPDGRVHR